MDDFSIMFRNWIKTRKVELDCPKEFVYPEDITAVRDSFEKLSQKLEKVKTIPAVELFKMMLASNKYRHLFSEDYMEDQIINVHGRNINDHLTEFIDNLDSQENLVGEMQKMKMYHASLPITPQDILNFETFLFSVLKSCEGVKSSESLEKAWSRSLLLIWSCFK